MTTYLCETENPKYIGKVAGVLFVEGKATLDEATVEGGDRDLAGVIRVFEDLGITVTEIFKCSDCGKVFESKNALSGHMKSHKKMEPPAEEDK